MVASARQSRHFFGSSNEGFAQIVDRYGNMQEVRCIPMEGASLKRGTKVHVVRTNSSQRVCTVAPDEHNKVAPDAKAGLTERAGP